MWCHKFDPVRIGRGGGHISLGIRSDRRQKGGGGSWCIVGNLQRPEWEVLLKKTSKPKSSNGLAPSVSTGLAAKFCDVLERAILWYFDDYSSKKDTQWLKGNYGPVPEMAPAADLPVSGVIPDCLNGEFVRVGPNPKFAPIASYHWFDGDGMLHGLRMKDGKATYVARYVRTSKLQQEEKFGKSQFVKIGDMQAVSGILYIMLGILRFKLGVLDNSNGTQTGALLKNFFQELDTGNTALKYHHNRILALNEGDKPYIIKVLEDGDLETLGREDYGGQLNHHVTAHPKLDPVTGELFIFGFDMEKSPHNMQYRVISKDGIVTDPVVITVPKAVLMHDFAITEHYAIFMDLPLRLDPQGMVQGEMAIKFDDTKASRLGVLPRYAPNEAQIKWFTIPTCFIFHNVNAWEEGDEVVLYSCRFPQAEITMFLEKHEEPKQNLYEFRLNLKTGEVKQTQLSNLITDFPQINEKYIGRKHRYTYNCIVNEMHKAVGLAKYNLGKKPHLGQKVLEVGGNIDGIFVHGPGRFGSEAVFVPQDPDAEGAEEDDGYLICFVHNENNGESEVVIIDAKTMAPKPVAVVKLPQRVPYGFHALFISEEQLKTQHYK